jgi:hypothetical protein
MINETATNQKPESTNHLKGIFEQSLIVLCEGRDAVTTKTQAGRVRRASLPLHIDAASLQKRALDDAAKALATLWNISKPERAKLHSRANACAR